LKQRRILKLLVQHEGDRKAVARRLRIAPESVDRAVHRMRVAARGRK
jgi:DNA-binding MarR family transcriptional regulator